MRQLIVLRETIVWGTRSWFNCATTDAAWILTSSFHFCLLNCVFRFPPTSIFFVTPSPDRLPNKAEDPYPAMRRLVIHRQTPTWKFQDYGGLLLLLLLLSLFWLLLILSLSLLLLLLLLLQKQKQKIWKKDKISKLQT